MLDAMRTKVIVKAYGEKHDEQSNGANRLEIEFGTEEAPSKALGKHQRQRNGKTCCEAYQSEPKAKLRPIPDHVQHVCGA